MSYISTIETKKASLLGNPNIQALTEVSILNNLQSCKLYWTKFTRKPNKLFWKRSSNLLCAELYFLKNISSGHLGLWSCLQILGRFFRFWPEAVQMYCEWEKTEKDYKIWCREVSVMWTHYSLTLRTIKLVVWCIILLCFHIHQY